MRNDSRSSDQSSKSQRRSGLGYLHVLGAAQKEFTCTEAARSSPEEEDGPAHDAVTRLFQRRPPSAVALWQEVESAVDPDDGLLIPGYDEIPIQWEEEVALADAIRVSDRHDLYAYDAYMLVAARRHQAPLLTLDGGLKDAARGSDIDLLEV